MDSWETELQDGVRELTREFSLLSALDDTVLGKASLVKHTMKVTDLVPFKERYRIPQHQFEEVRKHFKEMVELEAIRRSSSPWTSAVGLVRWKNGSQILHGCKKI